ncbi:hypothetical protein E2562_010000 [Oryza meyeriana var. granulata]|uniref:KIB1-4 beta-propeller domain-containing protein n=1 Tax=Oryza meyeriana var. granulata TaxID=110450 RepID=A0A6G1EHK4_9ORYZ|nr:hypothetical protein E2562_010000 [Oryza meyeriana var. granulata]
MDSHQSRAPWADPPKDILDLVVRRISCEVDRLRMGRVCHSWRLALAKLKPPAPPPPLPWLVLPETDVHGLTFSCVLSGWRRTHPFFLPHAARHARYFGSYDGVWLFLAVDGQGDEDQDHLLVNLTNFQFLDLPNAIRIDPMFPQVIKDIEIAIVAATLSRQPTEQGCIAAGIIQLPPFFLGVKAIAFRRMGDRVILPFYEEVCHEVVEDLLYYKGDFLLLTREEDIRVCPEPIFHEAHVQVVSNLLRFQPRGDDENILARYLVQSRGRVLMVVKLSSPLDYWPTSAFRVFQREDRPLDDGMLEYSWSELDKLDGRMLFLRRGCSRSYEAADGYPGMEGIYFLDDRSFHEPIFHDPDMAFDHAYHCSDNGKWSKSPSPQVDRCFPERGQSKYSSSVWILP